MARARHFVFVLLAMAAGVDCHSQSELLRLRDGGAGSGGIAGTQAGSGGAGGAAGRAGGAGGAAATAGSAAGAAGTAGGTTGGAAGRGGAGGGIGGRGGVGGTAGAAGTGGRGGADTGVAGRGGQAGSGGTAGAGGTAGRGGTSGSGGSAGSGCLTCRTTIVPVEARDVVYNAARNELYVSVSGDAQANGNTIVIVDPTTASIVSSIPIGSNPNALAVSDDGTTLWVGISGAYSFRKVSLASAPPVAGPLHLLRQAGTSFYTQGELVVMPGAPQSVAMALGGATTQQVQLFDDGVSRPTVAANQSTASLLAAGPPGQLFGADGSQNFYTFSVSASGITQTGSSLMFVRGPTNIVYDNGRVYGNTGDVIDVSNPAAPSHVGYLPSAGTSVAVRDAQSLLMLTPNALSTAGAVVRVLTTSSLSEIASVGVPAPVSFNELDPSYMKVVYAGADAVAVLRGHWFDQYAYVRDLVIIHDPAFGTPTGGASGGGGVAGGGASGAGTGGSGGTGGSAADPCPGCSSVIVPADGRHLAYDARRNLIYMTADGSAVLHPNSIVTVDPSAGEMTSIVPVGNDPQPLALSDDGSVLWVGLAGQSEVQRMTPGTMPVGGTAYPLPTLRSGQPAVPDTLVVLPGMPSSIAVSVFGIQLVERSVLILDDGVPRANFMQPADTSAYHLTNGPPGYLIGFGDTVNLVTLRLDTMAASYASYDGLASANYQYGLAYGASNAYAYAFGGEVIDLSNPEDPIPAGTFDFGFCSLAIRSARRVLLLCPNHPAIGPALRVLDTETFAQVGWVTLPDSLAPASPSPWADFAYVGGDAVAVLPWGGQPLQIVHVPLVGSQP